MFGRLAAAAAWDCMRTAAGRSSWTAASNRGKTSRGFLEYRDEELIRDTFVRSVGEFCFCARFSFAVLGGRRMGLLEEIFHFRDGRSVFRQASQVVHFLRVVLLVIQFCALFAESPLRVTPLLRSHA